MTTDFLKGMNHLGFAGVLLSAPMWWPAVSTAMDLVDEAELVQKYAYEANQQVKENQQAIAENTKTLELLVEKERIAQQQRQQMLEILLRGDRDR